MFKFSVIMVSVLFLSGCGYLDKVEVLEQQLAQLESENEQLKLRLAELEAAGSDEIVKLQSFEQDATRLRDMLVVPKENAE